ncbi:hypothetical protein RRG08_028516 [Elysia crispata]|uniref:Uncharacterized protein n=1 Tax=Elysia crispata TaxID=231223 RepID=A0AAE0Y9R9_9GAST|nr:hypothetical protein RRG08_028516 [Elysia crispata]
MKDYLESYSDVLSIDLCNPMLSTIVVFDFVQQGVTCFGPGVLSPSRSVMWRMSKKIVRHVMVPSQFHGSES